MKTLLAALILMVLGAPLRAQDDEGFEKLSLRVSSKGPGSTVSVDRGKSDGLLAGDLVLFYPRAGGTYRGSVIQLSERTAVVELLDKSFVPDPGTKGEVLVPQARLVEQRRAEERRQARQQQEVPPEEVQEQEGEVEPTEGGEEEPGEHEPWENQDEEYLEGMPLLAQIDAVRPGDRPRDLTGRWYFDGHYTSSTEENFTDTWLRAGTDIEIDNPFGRGGGFHFDAEYSYRATHVVGIGDEDTAMPRIDRLSYFEGGTRFADTRWEAGRFLQHGMPEFGVLDGAEWNQRLEGGHRVGASFGYMPTPDIQYKGFEDFQVAAYFEWVDSVREVLSVANGFQKTWHYANPDRDLLVSRVRYLPLAGWNFHGTTWIDFYHGGDKNVKDKTLELTMAHLSTGRRWDTGNGMEFTYRRIRFPYLLREEFLFLPDNELSNNRYDRLSWTGWRWIAEDTRFHGGLGAWDDEDESGGDTDMGFEVTDLFLDESRTDFTVFATAGQFADSFGGRLTYGRYTEDGRWDLGYEYVDHRHNGFQDDFSDEWEHRLTGTRSFDLPGGWNYSLSGYVSQYGDETAWNVATYIQRTF